MGNKIGEEMEIGVNNIGSAGAIAIADALKHNTTLNTPYIGIIE